jgi:hypothetical protein
MAKKPARGARPGSRSAATEKAAALRAAQRRREQRRQLLLISGGVIVVLAIIGVIVGIGLTGGGKKKPSQASSAAPAQVVEALTGVPPSVLSKAGGGGSAIITKPSPLSAPPLTADGKPRVLYVGAEYCPFCATERWPMVVALARFGTWSNLGVTHSASQDVYPNTATLSFHGATFQSDYLSFTGVETETNQPQGNGYAPLDTLSAADAKLVETYDKPPYTTGSAGSIPFIAFGGKFVQAGASYNPAILSGLTALQIAQAVHDGSSPVGTTIAAAANQITAVLCTLTGDKPAAVCSAAPIPQLQAALH